jgi:hypothetical protein
MLWVVQQNLSNENLQRAFREVLDPQLLLPYKTKLGFNDDTHTQQHDTVLSELRNQSHQIEIVLRTLKQHVNSPISASIGQRVKLASNVTIKEQNQIAGYKRASYEGQAGLDSLQVAK